jgi:hypothetical protein
MDILASILAYLGCITGIIGALAVSLFLVLAPPHARTAAPAPTAVLAAQASNEATSTISSNTITANTAPTPKADPVATVAQGANTATSEKRTAGAPPKTKTRLSRAQQRRIVQEERARRWAYQQDDDFETRFMSYAD